MIEKKKVYKCDHCGNVIEALWNGKPSVQCCGEDMKEMVPNTVDAAVEKHVPVINRDGDNVTVKVGEVAHPMEPNHFILFIEVVKGEDVYRHDLIEGDTVAEATFCIPDDGSALVARAYCNLHGFWASK